MDITFDPAKNARNIATHGVALDFAAAVLADPRALHLVDLRHDYGEERRIVYGMVEGRIWVCVYTPRGAARRIISVRKANARETHRYHATDR